MFRPAFGCCKHPKAGRNTQQAHFIPSLLKRNGGAGTQAKQRGINVHPGVITTNDGGLHPGHLHQPRAKPDQMVKFQLI